MDDLFVPKVKIGEADAKGFSILRNVNIKYLNGVFKKDGTINKNKKEKLIEYTKTLKDFLNRVYKYDTKLFLSTPQGRELINKTKFDRRGSFLILQYKGVDAIEIKVGKRPYNISYLNEDLYNEIEGLMKDIDAANKQANKGLSDDTRIEFGIENEVDYIQNNNISIHHTNESDEDTQKQIQNYVNLLRKRNKENG